MIKYLFIIFFLLINFSHLNAFDIRINSIITLEKNIPKDVKSVIYNFDQEAARWRLNTVFTSEKKFVNSKSGWKLST